MRALDRARPPLQARDRVVPARERHRPASQQALDDGDGFGEPLDPGAGRVEGDAGLVVLLPEPAGAEPQLEAPAREHVDGGGLLGEHHRVGKSLENTSEPTRSRVVAIAAAVRAGTGASWSRKWSGTWTIE